MTIEASFVVDCVSKPLKLSVESTDETSVSFLGENISLVANTLIARSKLPAYYNVTCSTRVFTQRKNSFFNFKSIREADLAAAPRLTG